MARPPVLREERTRKPSLRGGRSGVTSGGEFGDLESERARVS